MDRRHIDSSSLREAFIFDVDGTLALRRGRGAYEFEKVEEDAANTPVVTILGTLHQFGYEILYVSGRPEDVRTQTERWIAREVGVDGLLFMRPSGDFRSDVVIKSEIFEQKIRGSYEIVAVFDDRTRVVNLWRDRYGLCCLQVAPGDF